MARVLQKNRSLHVQSVLRVLLALIGPNILDLPACAARLASNHDNTLTLAVRVAQVEARDPIGVRVRGDRGGAGTLVAIVAWILRVAPWWVRRWSRRRRRRRSNPGRILRVFVALVEVNVLYLPALADRFASDHDDALTPC